MFQNGMALGIGSGSTIVYGVQRLGKISAVNAAPRRGYTVFR